MKVIPGQPLLTQVRIIAAPGDLSHEDIPNVGSCDVVPGMRLQSLEIVAEPVTQGTPKKSGFTTYAIRLAGSSDPWTTVDLGTLTATYDSASVKGAAQFTFLAISQVSNWETSFEEVIIVPRGRYFGDAKL